MGGRLELVATFPDTGPIKIANLADLGEENGEEGLASA